MLAKQFQQELHKKGYAVHIDEIQKIIDHFAINEVNKDNLLILESLVQECKVSQHEKSFEQSVKFPQVEPEDSLKGVTEAVQEEVQRQVQTTLSMIQQKPKWYVESVQKELEARKTKEYRTPEQIHNSLANHLKILNYTEIDQKGLLVIVASSFVLFLFAITILMLGTNSYELQRIEFNAKEAKAKQQQREQERDQQQWKQWQQQDQINRQNQKQLEDYQYEQERINRNRNNDYPSAPQK